MQFSAWLKLTLILHVKIVFLTRSSSSQQFAGVDKRRCLPDVSIAWSRNVGVAPFASAPLIADVDADGELDVIATTFSGEVHVLRAPDGRRKDSLSGVRTNEGWPYRLNYGSFYASPLQYDIDGDGMLDILVVTSSGKVIFLSSDGEPIINKHYQLDGVSVDRDWYLKQLTADQELIHDFILDDVSQAKPGVEYVIVDPHVLSTPVIDDINQDGVVEELVFAVSYYYDLNDDSVARMVDIENLTQSSSNYLVSALVFLNLTSMQTYLTVHLDLTKVKSDYPAYLLASPTVIDLDRAKVGMEIVIATAAGRLHVIDSEGHALAPFPLPTEQVHSQVTIEDVNSDGELELIVTDTTRYVTCYSAQGKRLWETYLPLEKYKNTARRKATADDSKEGTRLSTGARVLDVNGDGRMEILVMSDDGQVWMLRGESGEILDGWPVNLGPSVAGPPLVTRLHGLSYTALVSLNQNGELNILTADRLCRNRFDLGDTSLVAILSHDLIPDVPGLEFLVATRDGSLKCLVQSNTSDTVEPWSQRARDDRIGGEYLKSIAWPAETKTHNDFGCFHDQFGVSMTSPSSIGTSVTEFTATTFDVNAVLVDDVLTSGPYRCQVLLGSILLSIEDLSTPGEYTFNIASPNRPLHGHLVLECRNKHGKLLRDIVGVKFHTTFLRDLQWLLIGPTLSLVILLLFLFGFPSADILPVTVNAKHR